MKENTGSYFVVTSLYALNKAYGQQTFAWKCWTGLTPCFSGGLSHLHVIGVTGYFFKVSNIKSNPSSSTGWSGFGWTTFWAVTGKQYWIAAGTLYSLVMQPCPMSKAIDCTIETKNVVNTWENAIQKLLATVWSEWVCMNINWVV